MMDSQSMAVSTNWQSERLHAEIRRRSLGVHCERMASMISAGRLETL